MAVWETYMFFAAAEKLPFADDGEKIRDSVVFMRKDLHWGTKNSLLRCAEGSKDASG